ncbi:Gfo/Idh/MocA family oxidoreductase [Clostridiaceae bacterium M8S5]|nr:Gfo/Idh/MocA family oxidoreductase [Clostridiaceae bacterium M8S5]
MNIGILGTGFGRYHARLYRELDKQNSITIFGRDEEKLLGIRKELNIKTTPNIDDIIHDDNIDLVDICLPSSLHKEYVVKALKHGKHVFCETPLSLHMDEILSMKKAEKKYNKKIFVNQFIKHEYPYQYLYETTLNNSLGKLKVLNISRKTPPLWGNLGLENIVTNFMLHELDFVTWLLGMPKNISAYGNSLNPGKSNVSSLLKYDDTIVSVKASSMMPNHSPFTVEYEAIFDKGAIKYFEDGYTDKTETSLILFTNNEKKDIPILSSNCYKKSIKHVLECCTSNTITVQGIDDAMMSLKLAFGIMDSINKQ